MHDEADRVTSPAPSADGGAPSGRPSSTRRRRRAHDPQRPLSDESVASVRQAAVAIVRHRVAYLAIVEDGTLVGVLAVGSMWPQEG